MHQEEITTKDQVAVEQELLEIDHLTKDQEVQEDQEQPIQLQVRQ